MTDLWALGVTIFYLLTGRYPSGLPKNVMDLKEIVIKGEINFDFIKCKSARKLLTQILAYRPEDRATLSQIMSSDWITNSGKEKIDLTTIEKFGAEKANASFGNLQRLILKQDLEKFKTLIE